jgi:serine/threonine protein kinase
MMQIKSNKQKINNEIDILLKLKHENIVQLLEVFQNQKYIFLVMEYVEHDLL